jgi:hypothetical protein
MDKRLLAVERIREYEPWRQRAFTAIRGYEEKGPGPDLVAETVSRIIASNTPRLRYVIGRQARATTRLTPLHAPSRNFCRSRRVRDKN